MLQPAPLANAAHTSTLPVNLTSPESKFTPPQPSSSTSFSFINSPQLQPAPQKKGTPAQTNSAKSGDAWDWVKDTIAAQAAPKSKTPAP